MERTRPIASAEAPSPEGERLRERDPQIVGTQNVGVPTNLNQLTPEEMRKILQRAADLEREKNRSGEPSLDFAEVERIGVESGLSREALHRAFAELRTGALAAPAEPAMLDKLLGPETVSAQTDSQLPVEAARRRLEEILKSELLHPEERKGGRTTWAPTPGLWAAIQRGLNWQGQSAWQKGHLVTELNPAPSSLDARTLLRVEANPGGRAASLASSVAVGMSLIGVGIASSFNPVAAQAHAPLIFACTGVLSAGVTFGAVRWTYRQRLKSLRVAISRVLDKFSEP